jgi:hypothetical protein
MGMSSMENEGENAEHRRLVKALIQELKNQGFEILNAESDGYEPCSEIESCFPDVKSYNRKKEFAVFGLAKTCTDLAKEQTEVQIKIFACRFMYKGKSKGAAVPLCIAITKGCEKQLDDCLSKLKLNRKKNIFKYAF